ncbi:MAG: 2-oxoacid:ferredoxin oxidoreductase subunit beta [Rhodospirillaceae bacterium]|jgi:2-oxoglutarate ferredoxin oxidoreductase subunit beta|nr:2-oxoacid:ferredoxin oxidoreductase subunit beta [Rhodospirillaceae bacterium]MBT4117881.1 2-oxoacid:ferredoxin oxidoreductase subunit beta [Rhodospirillaceae bacterium]MBT4671129.1 2-oxoacid:ferredoxin oxidoreductase subunit beta [Rhodospirillaceae bacterium]MBT4718265.1 2-oxoacid:ferredoxin oxidoreductase subunit beta [Rhodospirillaceae bacterium]MBT4748271.1 2-oxoacid:ferredoxin oxidoreductase subunit beta [Rhodospirillaceae bacterium]
MNVTTRPEKLTPKDYASDQEVRWCPGCGDYAIVRAMQSALAEMQAPLEKTVFISGIGCAARFPYYMSTYGFHTIHGRAAAIATGTKIANPELDIWVISGDGDSLSIGGNHLMHVLRRNVDLQYILFNNEIYGLTKGQYSPTSRVGTRSPSTPAGSIDAPVSPTEFAIGCGARFVARGIDSQLKQLPQLFMRAKKHKGASFVEVLQNCIVYADGIYADFTQKSMVEEKQIAVEHGKPLLFGKDRTKGIRLKPGRMEVEVVTVGAGGIEEKDILVHDETNKMMAHLLASMESPEFPVAVGVLYCEPGPTYDEGVYHQLDEAIAAQPKASMNDLLRAGSTWTVE